MRSFIAAGVLAALVSRAAVAQQSKPSTFVIATDKDTIALEQFTRDAGTIVGDLRLTAQRAHTHYTVHLGLDGSADRVEVIDDAQNFFTGTIVFSATARMAAHDAAGSLADKIFVAPPNSYPTIGTSIALMEQLIRSTHPKTGDSVKVAVINIRNRNVGSATITRLSADSVRIECNGCQRGGVWQELRLAVSKDGDVTGGANPEQHWKITRR